jgi:hypothetical protein
MIHYFVVVDESATVPRFIAGFRDWELAASYAEDARGAGRVLVARDPLTGAELVPRGAEEEPGESAARLRTSSPDLPLRP